MSRGVTLGRAYGCFLQFQVEVTKSFQFSQTKLHRWTVTKKRLNTVPYLILFSFKAVASIEEQKKKKRNTLFLTQSNEARSEKGFKTDELTHSCSCPISQREFLPLCNKKSIYFVPYPFLFSAIPEGTVPS